MWLKKLLWMFNRRFLEPAGDSELWRDPERRLGDTLGLFLFTEWRLISFVAWYSHWSQKWQSGPEDGNSYHTVMILPLITITTINLVKGLTCMNSVISGGPEGEKWKVWLGSALKAQWQGVLLQGPAHCSPVIHHCTGLHQISTPQSPFLQNLMIIGPQAQGQRV